MSRIILINNFKYALNRTNYIRKEFIEFRRSNYYPISFLVIEGVRKIGRRSDRKETKDKRITIGKHTGRKRILEISPICTRSTHRTTQEISVDL